MVLNKLTNRKSEKGFTLVELLIVIVVIAILAAITIVAYSGITARANGSKAVANAESVQKVAESYNADNGYYPATKTFLTTGSASTHLPAGLLYGTPSPSNGTNTFNYYVCGTGVTTAPTTPSGSNPVAPTTIQGGAVAYWDYTSSAIKYIYLGTGVSAALTANAGPTNCPSLLSAAA